MQDDRRRVEDVWIKVVAKLTHQCCVCSLLFSGMDSNPRTVFCGSAASQQHKHLSDSVMEVCGAEKGFEESSGLVSFLFFVLCRFSEIIKFKSNL